MAKYKSIAIGVDPSYANTGISIAGDGKLLKVKSVRLDKYKSNSEKRAAIAKVLDQVLIHTVFQAPEVVCVIERARIHSGQTSFINIDAIKGLGALTAVVVDRCAIYDVPVFSVDTRCWKSQVVGTSKGAPNRFGVPEEKWPTVQYVCRAGFKDSILKPVQGRKVKGTFVANGIRYAYDNDAADSAAIAMFWYVGAKDRLKREQ